ncbi:MAG TPA: hypothetical protein VFT29_17415 [Gemmatimonadaceae bacterium]|nr:hypothetical protein [Gemmatimonadaceae bacterium]
MSLAGRLTLACAVLASLAFIADAQQQQQGQSRLAAGRVMRPSAVNAAPEPVAGQWVVLHRVGSDRAAALDSARSGADGRFQIRYTRSGSEDALYFVSSRYHGIAYFSPPLRADTVRGGDADVIVYETTTDSATLSVQGQHFVLSQARGPGDMREVAQIFELENSGTRTIVARDSTTPLWSTHVPGAADGIQVAPGDFSAGAVVFRPGRADLYAPISPGVRQLVITYKLPQSAFPLSLPIARPVGVLEVLLEEPRAKVEGPKLTEVASVAIDGRMFRRFIAHDTPASAVIRVSAPEPVARNDRVMRLVASGIALAMAAAFGVWLYRQRREPAYTTARPSAVESLVAELAALDARFERESDTNAARATYERERAALRERLEQALAAERMTA